MVRDFVARADAMGIDYSIVEAFDQPWKRALEGTVGGSWGVHDNDRREPKFRLGAPLSNHPDWRLKAGLGIGAALLVFASFWLGLRDGKRSSSWREDLACAAIALASGLLGLAAVNLPVEGEIPSDRLRAAAMLVLALVSGLASVGGVKVWALAVLVVEGAIPTKDAGIYCQVGGKTAVEKIADAAEDIARVVSSGLGILDDLRLRSYPKTSGATGMQIMIPLDRTVSYDEVRGFVGAISDLVHAADPETTTLEWEVSKRTGKVFLDVNMNREGANIASAYSVRPEPGAPVSAPLAWDEIAEIDPADLTIRTIFERIDSLGDLFAPVQTQEQSIAAAIKDLKATPRKARVIRR